MIKVNSAGTPRLATAADLIAVTKGLAVDQANELIAQATGMVERMTARVLHQRELTETLWCVDGASVFRLSQWPVSSVAEVEVDGVVLNADEYSVDVWRLYRLQDGKPMAWRGDQIKITYTAGYGEDEAPAELRRAVIDIAVNLNGMAGRDQTIRSVNVPDVETISFRDVANGGGPVPPGAMDVIEAYREYRC